MGVVARPFSSRERELATCMHVLLLAHAYTYEYSVRCISIVYTTSSSLAPTAVPGHMFLFGVKYPVF